MTCRLCLYWMLSGFNIPDLLNELVYCLVFSIAWLHEHITPMVLVYISRRTVVTFTLFSWANLKQKLSFIFLGNHEIRHLITIVS